MARMIVDLHTSIWTSLDQLGPEIARRIRSDAAAHWDQYEASAASHDRDMACVDGSLVRGFRSELLDARVPNELIADFVARDPGRRIGVAGIDPMSADAMDQLDAAQNLGLAAISVSPAAQGFHPAHSDAMPIYERCAELSMPVFVGAPEPLTPSSTLEFARPSLWDEVARLLPQLPIVIGHLGHPWVDETLALLGKHERVFADLAGVVSRPWQLYNVLVNAASLTVMDKLLFGSGFPNDTPAKAIETLYSINGYSLGTQWPTIPRSQLRGIVERDSLALLGIDAVIAAREDHDAAGDLAEDAPAAIDIVTRPRSRGTTGFPGISDPGMVN